MDAEEKGFESVFDNQSDEELNFDTMFSDSEDGSLIDSICGFTEDGQCETDFDELHQTDDDATPCEVKDELGTDNDTENAPKDAEGTDGAPDVDVSKAGDKNSGKDDEFGSDGVEGKSDADKAYADYNKEEAPAAKTGEGPDVKMDEEDQESEFDKAMKSESADIGDDYDSDADEFEDDMNDGLDDATDECKEDCEVCKYDAHETQKSFDDFMDHVADDAEPAAGAEGTDEEVEDDDFVQDDDGTEEEEEIEIDDTEEIDDDDTDAGSEEDSEDDELIDIVSKD